MRRTRSFVATAWAAITASGDVVERFAEQPSETPEGTTVLPERWEGTLVLENVRTEDDREFEEGSLSWRELPLPFMFMPDTDMGHMDAMICGTIETVERSGQELVGTGAFDLGGEAGREAARLVGDGVLRWVSVDVAVREFQVYMDGDCDEMLDEMNEEEIDAEPEDVDGDGDPEQVLFESGNCHIVYRVQEGVILGATIVSMPAFGDAQIRAVTAGGQTRRFRPSTLTRVAAWPVPMEGQQLADALTAAFSSSPPADWFDDPQLEEPTPVTVDIESGRVYGHVAQWGVCHRAFTDQCLLAPHSATGYQEFHTGGYVTTSEGDRVRVGNLTMDGLHADLHLNAAQARRHYEDSTTVWAQVRAGEDEHGVWIAGAVRPGLSDEQLRLAASLALSGDWRRKGGSMELMAALSVPVPGFPIGVTASAATEIGPRVRVEEEQVMALVAAGIVTDCGCGQSEDLSLEGLEERLRRVEATNRILEPFARERVLERLPS
jgi:hypothetical protein